MLEDERWPASKSRRAEALNSHINQVVAAEAGGSFVSGPFATPQRGVAVRQLKAPSEGRPRHFAPDNSHDHGGIVRDVTRSSIRAGPGSSVRKIRSDVGPDLACVRHDQHGARCVVRNTLADGAEQETAEAAESACANDEQCRGAGLVDEDVRRVTPS